MPKGKTRRSAPGDIEEEMGLEPDTGGNPAARMRPALLLRAELDAGHHRHDRGRGLPALRRAGHRVLRALQVYDERVGMVIGLRDPRRADRPVFVLHPLVGGAAISWLVALCFLVFGLFEIFAAMKRKSIGFSAWGIGLFSGIVNIVCAIMLFVSPILFSLLVAVFVLWRGVAMIAEGVTVGNDRLSLEERRGRYADRCADRRPMDARRASKQAAR